MSDASSPAQLSLLPSVIAKESQLDRLQREAFLRSRGLDPKEPLQLDVWPDDVREIPNDLARSAIFTVRNKKEQRAVLQGAPIFHIEKQVKITFTGIELRADDDELVWEQILEFSKRFPLGAPVEFNLHQLCVGMKWSINARNYDRARQCISRLKANELKVSFERLGGKGVAISLIDKYEFFGDGDKGTRYRVYIHPNLIVLFAGHTSTRVVWDGYTELKPLARRLYDYFASHKQPFPLKLDTFHKLCASTCGNERKWRAMVREACGELVKAGLIRKTWVNEDHIYCER